MGAPVWFAPDGVEPVYGYSFGRQNWFPHAAEEHRAAREAVALFDLSSFAKTEVAGPDAVRLLQLVCTNDVDVPREARLHVVPEPRWRYRERRDRDPARRRPLPRDHADRDAASDDRVAPRARRRDVGRDRRRHQLVRDAADGTAQPGAARARDGHRSLEWCVPVLHVATDPGRERAGARDPRVVRGRARLGAVRVPGVRGARLRRDRGRPRSRLTARRLPRPRLAADREGVRARATTWARPTIPSRPAWATS